MDKCPKCGTILVEMSVETDLLRICPVCNAEWGKSSENKDRQSNETLRDHNFLAFDNKMWDIFDATRSNPEARKKRIHDRQL